MTRCRHCRARIRATRIRGRHLSRWVEDDTGSPFCPGGRHQPDWTPRERLAIALARINRHWFT